jgi:flagellar basal-body rod protein FlgF
MNIGLYQNAASLDALERWQDTVTQNITSSQTHGYKRRMVQMGGRVGGGTWPEDSLNGSKTQGLAGFFPEARFAIAFTAGENLPTHRSLDLAISGPGFFKIGLPDDQIAYTRAGQFRVDTDLYLVSGQGQRLLNTDGDPIQLESMGEALQIMEDGTVMHGGAKLGQLAIEQPDFPIRMNPLTTGLFSAGPGAGMRAVEEPVVLQGYLESSNVKPLREMVDLVNITRAYEANHKMIQTRDQLLGRTLESLT